jgi:hypothetical protein
MPSIFLSHSHKDRPFVRRLAERLTKSGVVVLSDEVHLEIGDSIIGKIGDAIHGVDYVAAVISKALCEIVVGEERNKPGLV